MKIMDFAMASFDIVMYPLIIVFVLICWLVAILIVGGFLYGLYLLTKWSFNYLKTKFSKGGR